MDDDSMNGWFPQQTVVVSQWSLNKADKTNLGVWSLSREERNELLYLETKVIRLLEYHKAGEESYKTVPGLDDFLDHTGDCGLLATDFAEHSVQGELSHKIMQYIREDESPLLKIEYGIGGEKFLYALKTSRKSCLRCGLERKSGFGKSIVRCPQCGMLLQRKRDCVYASDHEELFSLCKDWCEMTDKWRKSWKVVKEALSALPADAEKERSKIRTGIYGKKLGLFLRYLNHFYDKPAQ